MSGTAPALKSTIGTKAVMALSGLALVGFVLVHMLGNLQVFAGPAKLNAYAATIQGLGPGLWAMRAGLLAIFVLHVWTALRLRAKNAAARPVSYQALDPQVTGPAARSMFWTGMLVLAFVVYHLLHFTLGVTDPAHFKPLMPDGHHDVYAMVVHGFRQWPVTVAYVVAQALLALHLSHGASSAFQTLGVTHPRFHWLKTCFGNGVAAVVFLGNVSIPVACLTGCVTLPAGA